MQMIRRVRLDGRARAADADRQDREGRRVRRRAIRSLGRHADREDRPDAGRISMRSEQDLENRKAVISALGRRTTPRGWSRSRARRRISELKTEIVARLSDMAPTVKVAADYMMEILKNEAAIAHCVRARRRRLVAASRLGPTAPSIQNGKVETRKPAALDREIATLAATATTEPAWVGWRVPMVDGDAAVQLRGCDDNVYFRGQIMDNAPLGRHLPRRGTANDPAAGPVPLEGGTGLVVLLRLSTAASNGCARSATTAPSTPAAARCTGSTVTPAESLALPRQAHARRRVRAVVDQRASQPADRGCRRSRCTATPAPTRSSTASRPAPNLTLRQRAISIAGQPIAARMASRRCRNSCRQSSESNAASSSSVPSAQTREPGTVGALRALLARHRREGPRGSRSPVRPARRARRSCSK